MTAALKKEAFKHVEAELYMYHETKKEISLLRNEIMYGAAEENENTGQGVNSVRVPGRPTERIVTRLMTNKKLRNLEEIVEAVEGTYRKLDDSQKQLIHLRYWNKSNMDWTGIALRCNISRATAFRYRDLIIETIAEKIGW